MAGYNYGFLPEQSHEDALHATRLLQVEERPFQRVTRNLLGKDSLLKYSPQQLPSPPPDGDDSAELATNDTSNEEELKKQAKFHSDILLDFAALESSIVRIQLLQSSNQRERERYAAEKAKIVETAQAVRDNTTDLRAQLAEAQRVLELRKGYDELAARLITAPPGGGTRLKARAETREEIEKLEKEIEDLEQESGEFEGVWAGRREAWERVVGEGQSLVKLIKGIKDDPEPEKDDAMDEGEESGEKGHEDRSRMGTPAPGDNTPLPGGQTPLPDHHGGGESPSRPLNKFLDVDDATRPNSRLGSPLARPADADAEVDVVMAEEEQVPLESHVKNTEGVEATEEQVATPAADVDMDES